MDRSPSSNNHYIPGMCNINIKEIRRRRTIGHIGLACSTIGIFTLLLFRAPFSMQLLITIPIFIATLSYLQAKKSFCVAYAFSGKQHTTGSVAQSIEDKKAKKTDNLRAKMIVALALIITITITTGVCFALTLILSA